MAKQWYYRKAGQQYGPVSAQELKRLAQSGEVGPTDYVRNDVNSDWLPGSKVNGLFQEVLEQAPPIIEPPPVTTITKAVAAGGVWQQAQAFAKQKSPVFWIAVLGGGGVVSVMICCGGLAIIGMGVKGSKRSEFPRSDYSVEIKETDNSKFAHRSGYLKRFEDLPPPVKESLERGHRVTLLRNYVRHEDTLTSPETRGYPIGSAQDMYVVVNGGKVTNLIVSAYSPGNDALKIPTQNVWFMWKADAQFRGRISIKEATVSISGVEDDGNIEVNMRIRATIKATRSLTVTIVDVRDITFTGGRWTESRRAQKSLSSKQASPTIVNTNHSGEARELTLETPGR